MTSRELAQLETQHRELIERAQEQLPVKLSSIAQQLGVRIVASTLTPGVSGELRPSADGKFVITVNRHDSQKRQRFTVAHELAHFLLHRNQIGNGIADDVLYRSTLSDMREAEANRLAADILMPIVKVQSALVDKGGIALDDVVTELALQFGVSDAAMRIRLGLD